MALLIVLSTLVAVLHGAHLTGLRNTLAVAVAVWVVSLLLRDRTRPPLAAPLVAWVALAATSCLWSPDASTTLKSVLTDIVLPAGGLYAAYFSCGDAHRFRVMALALAGGLAFIAALTLFAVFSGEITALQPDDRDGLLRYYPGPGVASTLALFALPFGLLLSCARNRALRPAGVGLLACILIVGLGSLNRMFWLASVIVVAVFYAWQWAGLLRWQRRIFVGGTAVGVAAAISMVAYLTHARDSDEINRDTRLQAWQEWAVVAREAPILGHGFGKKIVRDVGEGRLSPQVTERHPYLLAHGHNVFLVVFLQLGLVGLALFCVLLGAVVREAWRGRAGGLVESAALAALLAGMLAKNFTDDFMDHAVVVAFWTYVGILLGRLRASGP